MRTTTTTAESRSASGRRAAAARWAGNDAREALHRGAVLLANAIIAALIDRVDDDVIADALDASAAALPEVLAEVGADLPRRLALVRAQRQ